MTQGYYPVQNFAHSIIRDIRKSSREGLAFSIFIRIWVTFEMVELTQSKECKSQEKIVKI